MCTENTVRGCVSRHPPSTVFLYTQARRCFKCYIVLSGRVWLGAIFSSTQTAAIFGDKDISKCLTNLFLVVERTNMISLASFSDLQCHASDQSCCLSGVMFKKPCDEMISKCLYNVFLAVERTRRISLADFSDLQCVVYVTFLK